MRVWAVSAAHQAPTTPTTHNLCVVPSLDKDDSEAVLRGVLKPDDLPQQIEQGGVLLVVAHKEERQLQRFRDADLGVQPDHHWVVQRRPVGGGQEGDPHAAGCGLWMESLRVLRQRVSKPRDNYEKQKKMNGLGWNLDPGTS